MRSAARMIVLPGSECEDDTPRSSSLVAPDARRSRTSLTRMRGPRMHGRPPPTSGFGVIRPMARMGKSGDDRLSTRDCIPPVDGKAVTL